MHRPSGFQDPLRILLRQLLATDPLRRLAALVTCAVLLATPASVPALAPIVHSPRVVRTRTVASAIANAGWTSSNWSGYAVRAGPYTSVTSIWRVPTVTASAKATYSSSWVGIDGFNNRNLIQTGTEQDYYGGSAHYSAWWEILPAAGMVISSLTIHPGDTMSATIARNPTGGTWRITLTDRTTGKTFSTVRTYHGTGSSAEWIQEAPMVGGSVATLAHDSLTTFVGTANGGYPQLVASNRGTMVQNGVRVSTPSVPDRRTHGFSVRYAG